MANRQGVDLAPSHSLAALLHDAMTGWGYNTHDLENQIRAQSIRLRNLAGEALAHYLLQLRGALSALRRGLPEPTRENPFPPKEQLQEIAEWERHIRDLEDLRVSLEGQAMPTRDIVWRQKGEHLALLDRLRAVDLEIFTVLLAPDDDVAKQLRGLLHKRELLLRDYIAWG